MPDSTVTQMTAIYAALVSTGTAAWAFYKDIWREQGRLRVKCGFRELVTPHAGIEHDLLIFEITNVGTKPVRLNNVGGFLSNGKGFVVVDDKIPKKLDPGDVHYTMMREFEGLDIGITALEVYDSLDRTYRANKADVEKVNEAIKELAAKGKTKSWFEPHDPN